MGEGYSREEANHNEDILRYKVLPLTRARDFLKIITSFAGRIEPFSSPDLSLYYTLTRKKRGGGNHELGESILYITVLDHKERTTRVYTQDNEMDTFLLYEIGMRPSLMSDTFLLEVEIDVEIDPR